MYVLPVSKVQDLFWLLRINPLLPWILYFHAQSDAVLHDNHQSSILLDEKDMWEFSFINFGLIWVTEYGSYLTIVLQSRQSVLAAKCYLRFVAVKRPQKAKYWMFSSALAITRSWRWLLSCKQYLVFFGHSILLYYLTLLFDWCADAWTGLCLIMLNTVQIHMKMYSQVIYNQ